MALPVLPGTKLMEMRSWWELARCGTSGMLKNCFLMENPRSWWSQFTKIFLTLKPVALEKTGFVRKCGTPKWDVSKHHLLTGFLYTPFSNRPNWTNTANQTINNPCGKWDHWDHFGSLLIAFPKMNPMKFWWFNQFFSTGLVGTWKKELKRWVTSEKEKAAVACCFPHL